MSAFRSIEGGFPDSDLQDLHELVSCRSWIEPKRSIDERGVADYIMERLQNCGCKVWPMPVEEHRKNVIAEKGTGNEFVLWVIGHMDTDRPRGRWREDGCSLRQSTDGDVLTGVGVWDMKIGLLQMMKAARELEVPKGMKIIYVFLVDEELNSKGIRAVLNYPDFPKPDFVVSPEIPTVSRQEMLEGGRRHPIVVARRGHAKFTGVVQVQPTHGADDEVPDVANAHREVANLQFQHLYADRRDIDAAEFLRAKKQLEAEVRAEMQGHDERQIRGLVLQRWVHYLLGHRPRHPLFKGEKALVTHERTIGTETPYVTVPMMKVFNYSHFIVPPMTVADTVELHFEVRRRILRHCDFAAHNIDFILRADHEAREPYEPFVMDTQHRFMHALACAVDAEHSEKGASHVFVGGNSPSDMSKVAETNFLGAEVAGIGRNPHAPNESASNRESYRNFLVLKRFITVELPRCLEQRETATEPQAKKLPDSSTGLQEDQKELFPA